jgi:RNase P subunit RPR2
MGKASRLPAGYVERAVAEMLAMRDRMASTAEIPFAFCPGCGAALADPGNFVQEFWVAEEARFLVWCRACGFTGTVVKVERFEAHEAAD